AGALLLAGLVLAPPLHAERATAAAAADAPAPVALRRPADGASVSPGRQGTKVDLTWQRSHGSPIWYFVEVVASGSGETREVFTGYTRQPDLRVPLDGAGSYAWRVVAVNRASAHYSVSPWRSFTVEDASEATR
ncbi:MAG: hypothetical protein JO157_02790, partial [Acetobacteraceae bacterium]|nr:hypothetical protein [Acetobacteraceae bacterium]